MIKREHQNKTAVIRLYRPPANVIDIELCSALEKVIRAETDSDSKAIILTGHGSIFSAGVDLLKLLNSEAGYIRQFLTSLEQLIETLYFCPKPVVAAINGHAIAGGCVIASCADHRLMAQGKGRIGVPELRVGVPFPVIIMELMRARVDSASFQEIVLGGDTYTTGMAIQKGLIDEIVSPEDLMDKAQACALSLAGIRPEIYSFTKLQVRQPVRDMADAQNKVYGDEIYSIWESEQTRQAIRQYMEKTFKKT